MFRRHASAIAVFWGVCCYCFLSLRLLLFYGSSLPPKLSAVKDAPLSDLIHHDGFRLRFDWSNLKLVSPLAKAMDVHQTNCSLPLGNVALRNKAGLGSDLHVYGQTILNAMEAKGPFHARVRTQLPWIYLDEEACRNTFAPMVSSMQCYFPRVELQCPGDQEMAKGYASLPITGIANLTGRDGQVTLASRRIFYKNGGKKEVRAAATEYLFHNLSRVVIAEAQRQLRLVFGSGSQNHTSHNGTKWRPSPIVSSVPGNLITVHIRWGDKSVDMKLVEIEEYIEAVKLIERTRLEKIERSSNTMETRLQTNVFLATESPQAMDQFLTKAPSRWNVFVDQYYFELLPHRMGDISNGNPKVAAKLKGRTGLVALASILLAMEANDFVLTTSSNWSRLLDELRRNVIEPRCRGCTSMIDLNNEKAGF